MSKKKRGSGLEEIIFRNQFQNYLYQNEQAAPYENAIQKAEAEGVLHEQRRVMQRNSDMVYFAMELQKVQRDFRKAKKTMDEMVQYFGALTKRCSKTEKKVWELSEKVHSLCQDKSRQKEKLKKYRLQMHQQKKVLRFMGAYIGVNSPTDNLGKIASKCSKKIGTDYMRNAPRIIDADYREV